MSIKLETRPLSLTPTAIPTRNRDLQHVPKVTVPQNQNWLNKTNVIAGVYAVILGGAALYCYKSGYFPDLKIEPGFSIPGPLGHCVPGFVNDIVSWFDSPMKYSHLVSGGLYGVTTTLLSSVSCLSSVSLAAVVKKIF